MSEQRYYAVLDRVSEIDLHQARVVEYLGFYDLAYDALDRFLMFYDPDEFYLYSFPTEYSLGGLLELKKVPIQLPEFSEVIRCLAV